MGDYNNYMKKRSGDMDEEDIISSGRLNNNNNNDFSITTTKRRKLYTELQNEYEMPTENSESTTSGSTHDEYSNDVVIVTKSPDLESDNFVTEFSTSAAIFSRETSTPTSELFGNSEKLYLMDSSSSCRSKKKPSFRMKIVAAKKKKMPTTEELEEFFAAAEKQDQKRFTEKYNYDVVKDVPLEGKYQWVRL